MKRKIWLLFPACLFLAWLPAGAQGIDVGKPSQWRNLVSAEQVETQANRQYADLKRQAAAQHALLPEDDPQLKRLRAIAQRLIPHAERYNPRAKAWQWEVNLIGSQQINAFCMPGGKIAFFTAILDQLKLSDDEAAMVMGHEMAHALREHARAQIAKSQATQLGADLLGQFIGRGQYRDWFRLGGNLLTLRFSRDDESEADAVGLDLAARSGFDPHAAVSLWQKMVAAQQGAPLPWLSTHPSGPDRIKALERRLPEVMPLYEAAKRGQAG